MTDTTITATVDLDGTADLDSFRQRCREFLAANHKEAGEIDFAWNKEFLKRSAAAGLAGIPYPSEYGGG
ncbi:MAG TPA: acyl-CoA dehydrogenase family protein, partial [Ilumatobacteraceae bacterium]|nr:acyl-CoA dehydrogenase family protein [Ilumatobacteraceae bacterium]